MFPLLCTFLVKAAEYSERGDCGNAEVDRLWKARRLP
jgi:hypothetical protein